LGDARTTAGRASAAWAGHGSAESSLTGLELVPSCTDRPVGETFGGILDHWYSKSYQK